MMTEVLDRDNTTELNISLSFINSYIYNQKRFITENNLSSQSFELLLLMVNYYSLTNKGMSCTTMLNESAFSVRYYQKIYSMLNTLHNNGMVEYIGNGYLNCKLFAPTTKAIEGINNLVSSISV